MNALRAYAPTRRPDGCMKAAVATLLQVHIVDVPEPAYMTSTSP